MSGLAIGKYSMTSVWLSVPTHDLLSPGRLACSPGAIIRYEQFSLLADEALR